MTPPHGPPVDASPPAGAGAPVAPGPRVTTTDLLKALALGLMLVDHVGLLFRPDEPAWRVLGRGAAPLFFFLVGLSARRGVPASWLALGALLTGLDLVDEGLLEGAGIGEAGLNVLFNLALVRLLLPLAEPFLARDPRRLLVLAGVCLLLVPAAGPVVEYGAEGWLWALLGRAQRGRLAPAPAAGSRAARDGVALLALLAYVVTEARDHDLSGPAAAALLAHLGALTGLMTAFARAEAPWPPRAGAGLLRFCGRHSLTIYAASLALMQGTAMMLGTG